MSAYYNEFDPFAAQWLRNLIAAGHIAAGDVDERSIVDVTPSDLAGYTQCHFFAGIGVWSYALRLAGWSDDRPVWTGSCPCQPFSAAGKGAGFADERHLWPAWQWLIAQRRPPAILGEQVASKDAEPWLDLVQADMEALGYSVGAVPFPSAGVGAPHIRDRLYWVAHTDHQRRAGEHSLLQRQKSRWITQDCTEVAGSGAPERVVDNNNKGLEGFRRGHSHPVGQRQGTLRSVAASGESCGLVACEFCGYGFDVESLGRYGCPNCEGDGLEPDPLEYPNSGSATDEIRARWGLHGISGDPRNPGPTNGFWRDADWLLCRDGKWRPVEPGTFPLAHGATSRVGRLRGYGNAINAQAAKVFIKVVMECQPC